MQGCVQIQYSKGALWVQVTSDSTGVVHRVDRWQKSDWTKAGRARENLPMLSYALPQSWQHVCWRLVKHGTEFFRCFYSVIPHTKTSRLMVSLAYLSWGSEQLQVREAVFESDGLGEAEVATGTSFLREQENPAPLVVLSPPSTPKKLESKTSTKISTKQEALGKLEAKAKAKQEALTKQEVPIKQEALTKPEVTAKLEAKTKTADQTQQRRLSAQARPQRASRSR